MAFILLVYFAKRARLALMHGALYPRQLDVACSKCAKPLNIDGLCDGALLASRSNKGDGYIKQKTVPGASALLVTQM